MLLFDNFNLHHKDRLTYSRVTNRSGKPCNSFPNSHNLTKVASFPGVTITERDTDDPDILELFLGSEPCFCFPPCLHYFGCLVSV